MWGKVLGQEDDFAEFDLSPTLPSRVWKKIGGHHSGNADTFTLAQALHGVNKKKQSVHDRLVTLRRLAEHWHGPLQPGDGFTEDELQGKPIPYPLRWWYQLAGHRTNIMSGPNFLQEPDRLELDQEGRVAFSYENQCCYQWGTTLESDDPPVLGREAKSDPWTPEGMVLSEFLIEACMCEAIIHAPYAASAAWIVSDVLATIAARIPALPLAPWRWPEATKFYAANGAFMLAMPNGEYGGKQGHSVWIGAKTEHPLAFLKAIVNDKNWEYISL